MKTSLWDKIFAVEPRDPNGLRGALELLPLKFSNAVPRFLPMGQQPLAIVHWPAILEQKLKLFRHELAPEALLALTERELLFISEEKAGPWIRPGRVEKHGSIASHCPLSRIEAIQLNEHETFDTLNVTIRAGHGGETLRIDFPRDQRSHGSGFCRSSLDESSQ